MNVRDKLDQMETIDQQNAARDVAFAAVQRQEERDGA